MAKASLTQIVRCCDRTLRTSAIQDYPGAVNGLQVENRGAVTRIAAAVDASPATIDLAIAARADLLLVHHGLFWTPRQPWTATNYRIIQRLLESNLAIYSSHLPLDLHPKLGNNALLCASLGLRTLQPFFFAKENFLGFKSKTAISRTDLAHRLHKATGAKPIIIPGGPSLCRLVGVVTGGAGSELKLAAQEGVDTFITGEGPHWTFALAEELGVNVLYGGHYATETFGVKALAADLARKFRLPWTFLDHPTGL